MPNKIDLSGRIGVVTGGGVGIGLAVCERLTASGAKVAIWDRDLAAGEKAAKEIGGGAKAFQVDVADPESVNAGAAATLATFGKVDLLVNNAGIAGPTAKSWEYDVAELKHTIAVNLEGPFNCCHALVPGMIAQNYGRIVNIASIAGKEGNPNASAYSASKAGLIGLTKSIGKELASYNITCNAVTPAVARTDILKQMTQQHIDYMISKIPMGRTVETKEIAALVAWAVSEDCSFTTGATFDISGGRATY